MPKLVWKRLVGQQRIKEILSNAFAAESLGHAYLFSGDEGTGKLQAALELAMALLCKEPDSAPCYECQSCRRILNHAHPDFHLLFPVSLQGESKTDGGISAKGWDRVSEIAADRIAHPYNSPHHEGIPAIPVEWTRETVHAIIRGTIEGPRCVAIIDGIDVMNKESANTLLKTLEEPPADTIIIVLTDRLHATLQTIISRCQVLRFGYVSPEELRSGIALHAGSAADPSEVETIVPAAMGSLGRALTLLENPDTESFQYAQTLLSLCVSGNWEGIGECVDELSGAGNLDLCMNVFFRMAFLIRNAMLKGSIETEKYILEDRTRSSGADMPLLHPSAAREILKQCQSAINALSARANIALTLATFAFSLSEIFNGQEYKVS